MGIIEREPGTASDLPYRNNGKVENFRVPPPIKLGDAATAASSQAITETIDGTFNATIEGLAREVRGIPIIGPGLSRALMNAVMRIKKGSKAPASTTQSQAQVHAATELHALAVLVDAAAYWIGDFSEAVYNTFSTLRHITMPAYVEKVLKPVRLLATKALRLATAADTSLKGGLAAINSLAQTLPWNFNAATFPKGMAVFVSLFTRLWHKVYDNIELRLGHIEGVDLVQIRGLLTKLSTFVHGSLVPDLTKVKQQMTELLTKTLPALRAKEAADATAIAKLNTTTIPAINAKQAADEKVIASQGLSITALLPLLGAAGFASAFSNAISNAPNEQTAICDPVTQCVGSNVLSKGGWSWLKNLLPAILAGAIDALLLSDMCVICKAASALVGVVEPELRAIAVVENGLASIGCASSPAPMPPPAYS